MNRAPEITRRLLCVSLLCAGILLQACAGGYHTTRVNGVEKVYHVDEQGNKALVYEVDRDGKTTVYKADDPKYRQLQTQQQQAEKMQQMQDARIEQLKKAPKRRNSDPIYVALHPIQLDDKLKKSQHSKGAVNDQYRKEFKPDRIIRLVSKKERKRNEWAQMSKVLAGENPYAAQVADVEVVSRAYLKEVYGINKKTRKPGQMLAIVFEATIKSNYLPAEYSVEESGNIFRNVEVTQRFVNQIKHVIKTKIGPSIPARQRVIR